MNALMIKDGVATREVAISLLSGNFRKAAESLSDDILSLSLEDLAEERKPTQVDFFLRKRLWELVGKQPGTGRDHIDTSSVYSGICSKQAFDRLLTVPNRVAWLLADPKADLERAEYGFNLGLTNLIKLVSKEPTAETSGAFLKAMEMLWNRVHGPVVTRVDARHAHLHVKGEQAAKIVSQDLLARADALKGQLLEQRHHEAEVEERPVGESGEETADS